MEKEVSMRSGRRARPPKGTEIIRSDLRPAAYVWICLITSSRFMRQRRRVAKLFCQMVPPAAAFPRMGTPSEILTAWYLLVWAATPLTIPMACKRRPPVSPSR